MAVKIVVSKSFLLHQREAVPARPRTYVSVRPTLQSPSPHEIVS